MLRDEGTDKFSFNKAWYLIPGKENCYGKEKYRTWQCSKCSGVQ